MYFLSLSNWLRIRAHVVFNEMQLLLSHYKLREGGGGRGGQYIFVPPDLREPVKALPLQYRPHKSPKAWGELKYVISLPEHLWWFQVHTSEHLPSSSSTFIFILTILAWFTHQKAKHLHWKHSSGPNWLLFTMSFKFKTILWLNLFGTLIVRPK